MTSGGSRLPCPPLYGTPRVPERPTYGPAVAAVAQTLGKPLQPWQRYVADVAHEIDPATGQLVYDEVLLVVNRQQGKSELTLPVMVHRAVGALAAAHGPQRILYAAQTADEARKKWNDHHLQRLVESPLRPLFRPRKRLNFEAILWKNGSTHLPVSTTGKTGGTGDSTDLGIVDEAWVHDSSRVEQGMRPTMLTRAEPQLWVVSMVPGPTRASTTSSSYLRGKLARGRALVEAGVRSGTAVFVWGARPGLDPADPATWWSCMPALGHTVTEAAVKRDFRTMELADFLAEYLGWWPDESPTAGWRVVTQAEWEAATRPRQAIEGRPALGVWVSPDRGWAAIAAAGLREGAGRMVELTGRPGEVAGVVLPDYRQGAGWLAERLRELERHRPLAVVTNDRVLADECGRDVVRLVTGPDVASACTMLVEGVAGVGGDVRHRGQPDLTAAVALVTWERVGAGKVFAAPSSDVDISPAAAAALALWAWSTPRVHRPEADLVPMFAWA